MLKNIIRGFLLLLEGTNLLSLVIIILVLPTILEKISEHITLNFTNITLFLFHI